MGVMRKLRETFGGRPPRPLSGPDSFEPAAEADEDSRDMLAAAPAAPQPNVDGLVLGMAYTDTHGRSSRRMVRVKAIGPSDHGGYLHGFCELRQADRTFRIGSIGEVVDHRSGERFTDAAEFFLPYVEIARWRDFAGPASDDGEAPDATRQVLSSVRDEIKIALYVARADGEFRPDEADVLSDFIAGRAASLGDDVASDYDHARIMDWAGAMYPDYAAFERAVQRLSTRRDVDIAEIWRTCKKLVVADRSVQPSEVDAMDSLFVAIRNAGISKALD